MKKHYQSILLLALAFAASAAPLPENIRDAVQQVRKSNGVQPRQPFYLLEQAVPKAAGDARGRIVGSRSLLPAGGDACLPQGDA